MNTLALLISRSGDGWLYFAVGLYLTLATSPLPTPALLSMTLAVCFSMGFTLGTKPLVARPRPETSAPTRLLAIDRHSFPSGHTFTAAAFMVACGWHYPWALAVLVPYTCLMAWSRVWLKAHYWSDCIAAGIWGLMVGWGSVMLVRWMVS